MRLDKIKEQGIEPIKQILKTIGGWPLLEADNWNETKFTLTDSTYKLKTKGYIVNCLFQIGVDVDPKNNTKYVIYVSVM